VEVRRRCDPGAPQARVLVALAGGVVDLDDAQVGRPGGLPVGERVEAGPEDHVVAHPALHRVRQAILGVPAAHHHLATQGPCHRGT
jgi:hypothetical protein